MPEVAVIAVYSFIFCQLIGAQYVDQNDTITHVTHDNALPVPIFNIFYFLFLKGWLKVALCVMNPFGDDYEDFECSAILDFNLDVSYRAILLDEATYPESLKTATFTPKPMKGAENDNLDDFLDNITRETQEADFNEEMNETAPDAVNDSSRFLPWKWLFRSHDPAPEGCSWPLSNSKWNEQAADRFRYILHVRWSSPNC
ncbi:unnamed protein product [Dibothriocephalus latus]|uniref:Bestrophin homolog n=1 Tax=Dibothriocephalus latus TaxID=60516 RepID=A0A3P7LDK1_DIBLA|nr:unnamed protein product [Dibothriocephalus latus]